VGNLGIYLLFVGITLVVNGAARFTKIDGKSVALMNALTALVIIVGSLINFNNSTGTGDYVNVASGFLFGFTYIFIALNYWLNLDWRVFGWFSLGVTIWALFHAILSFQVGSWSFVYLWVIWALLWLNGFLDTVVGMKSMGKIFPYLSIVVGVAGAFVPALMMLTDTWPA
jgi:acid-activated urea channel